MPNFVRRPGNEVEKDGSTGRDQSIVPGKDEGLRQMPRVRLRKRQNGLISRRPSHRPVNDDCCTVLLITYQTALKSRNV